MSSILFISMMNGGAWGGSEELWYQTALHAAQSGRRVGCVVYHWSGKEARMKKLEDAGCRIYYLPNKGRQKRNLIERIQNKITKKITVRKYISKLPVDEYDLVVLNQGYFEVTMPVWRNFFRRLNKYALLYHNYREDETFKEDKAQVLKNWVQHASINLFASKRIGAILEKRFGEKISNAAVLVNPITFHPPNQLTPYPVLEDGKYVFVMLAALDVRRKAQDRLITVLSSSKWRERNCVLHLYGEGVDRKKLEVLIESNNAADKIFLKGHVSDVRSVLENAHLLLQITNIDAMPLAVVEAMAMSRPLVVSRIGDMPDWVEPNVNGWICDNASLEEIDRVLEQAWNERDKWEEMGRESFRIFSKKFVASPAMHLLQQLGV
jgi:glycosyltransferase involved in cell wall biosynthesis